MTTGWHLGYEANEVRFDPRKVSVKQMEEALRDAGTYRKTF